MTSFPGTNGDIVIAGYVNGDSLQGATLDGAVRCLRLRLRLRLRARPQPHRVHASAAAARTATQMPMAKAKAMATMRSVWS